MAPSPEVRKSQSTGIKFRGSHAEKIAQIFVTVHRNMFQKCNIKGKKTRPFDIEIVLVWHQDMTSTDSKM
jgi:hypothetical protein